MDPLLANSLSLGHTTVWLCSHKGDKTQQAAYQLAQNRAGFQCVNSVGRHARQTRTVAADIVLFFWERASPPTPSSMQMPQVFRIKELPMAAQKDNPLFAARMVRLEAVPIGVNAMIGVVSLCLAHQHRLRMARNRNRRHYIFFYEDDEDEDDQVRQGKRLDLLSAARACLEMEIAHDTKEITTSFADSSLQTVWQEQEFQTATAARQLALTAKNLILSALVQFEQGNDNKNPVVLSRCFLVSALKSWRHTSLAFASAQIHGAPDWMRPLGSTVVSGKPRMTLDEKGGFKDNNNAFKETLRNRVDLELARRFEFIDSNKKAALDIYRRVKPNAFMAEADPKLEKKHGKRQKTTLLDPLPKQEPRMLQHEQKQPQLQHPLFAQPQPSMQARTVAAAAAASSTTASLPPPPPPHAAMIPMNSMGNGTLMQQQQQQLTSQSLPPFPFAVPHIPFAQQPAQAQAIPFGHHLYHYQPQQQQRQQESTSHLTMQGVKKEGFPFLSFGSPAKGMQSEPEPLGPLQELEEPDMTKPPAFEIDFSAQLGHIGNMPSTDPFCHDL